MSSQSKSVDPNPGVSGRRGMFEWGLFGWFALLSWAGVILIVIAMLMGDGR